MPEDTDTENYSDTNLAIKALGTDDASAFKDTIEKGLYDRAADALAIRKVEVAQHIFNPDGIPEVDPHTGQEIDQEVDSDELESEEPDEDATADT